VLGAKPDSVVAVLADGSTPLTAFLPTDRAFRKLAYSLTGHWYRSESRVFTRLAGTLGVDKIESVLLHHVPRVVQRDINKGNLQIAHGIDRVLRPIDL
jgi:uncharacterized surface protein with fasciclin (FAS1) repeats